MSDTHLLTMIKPDGLARVCTTDEARSVTESLADLLAWLSGADAEQLQHSRVVGKVARRAGLRMVREPSYDIGVWSAHAADLNWLPPEIHEPVGLAGLATSLLQALGLTVVDSQPAWLNRVTIELLYHQAPKFNANRDLLVPLLLKGPVLLQLWRGDRRQLAFAVKLLLRLGLGRSDLTNLIHMETTAPEAYHLAKRSLEIDDWPAELSRSGSARATDPGDGTSRHLR